MHLTTYDLSTYGCLTKKIVGSWSPTYGTAPVYEYHKVIIRGSSKKNYKKILQKLRIVFTAFNVVGILYNNMSDLRIDRKALKAKLNIRRGSGLGRAIRKALLTKTPFKVADTGLKVTEMNTYERIYNMLIEGALSKEVREEPGEKMMLARGRIGAGQLAKAWKDKKGARKQGRKASKLIAQHRSKKRKKEDRAEARAQTVSFTTGNLRARRGK
jgi:hypothetical protein